MKGLVLKDLYLTFAKQKMLLLLTCFLLGVALMDNNNLFLLIYSTVFITMLPISLLSMDESEKWTTFCETLPVTKGQYVSGKMILYLVTTCAFIALTAVTEAVWMVLYGGFDETLYTAIMLGVTLTPFVVSSVQFPIIFRFGAEKGRIIFLSLYLVLSLSSVYFLNKTTLLSWLSGINIPILIGAVAAIFTLSWLLSIRMYEKRTK